MFLMSQWAWSSQAGAVTQCWTCVRYSFPSQDPRGKFQSCGRSPGTVYLDFKSLGGKQQVEGLSGWLSASVTIVTDQREENVETVKKVHSDRAPEGNGSRHNSEVCVSGAVKCHCIRARVCTLKILSLETWIREQAAQEAGAPRWLLCVARMVMQSGLKMERVYRWCPERVCALELLSDWAG